MLIAQRRSGNESHNLSEFQNTNRVSAWRMTWRIGFPSGFQLLNLNSAIHFLVRCDNLTRRRRVRSRIFISSVQREFARERRQLAEYIRKDLVAHLDLMREDGWLTNAAVLLFTATDVSRHGYRARWRRRGGKMNFNRQQPKHKEVSPT